MMNKTLQSIWQSVCHWATNFKVLFCVWLIMPVFVFLKTLAHEPDNTYNIFRYAYIHAVNLQPLYGEHPSEYSDLFLYGPFFSIFVAPFSMLPLWVGYALWLIAMSMTLYVAIRVSSFTRKQQVFLLLFTVAEMLNCIFQAQTNGLIAALLLFSFAAVETEHDEWSTFAVLVGTFIKLYGIVGLVFFFFSKHKRRYVISFVVWAIVFFVAPMLISSPQYVVEQYRAWFESLVYKDELNIHSWDQNISLLGIVRRWSGCMTYSDLWIILPGIIIYALGYFRIGQWKNRAFHEMVLASTMMFVTLFSTGTESYGHIISMVGVGIWYTAAVPWKRSKWDIFLLVFAFYMCSLSPGDLCPAYIRKTYIIPYSLKALPIAIIWFKLSYEMITRDYSISHTKCIASSNYS